MRDRIGLLGFIQESWIFMRFKALHVAPSGNLVLESVDRRPVANKLQLYYGGKRIGEVFDTIGGVGKPYYLARVKDAEKYVGKELEGA